MFRIVSTGILTLVCFSCAYAEWARVAQAWPPNMPDSTLKWFKQQKSLNGYCCDVADGWPTEWQIKDGKYMVFDERSSEPDLYASEWNGHLPKSTWREIPKEALIVGSPNPTGRGVIWYMRSRNSDGLFGIRCFVPGSEI